MTNLALYITADDYENFRGGDWPTFDDYNWEEIDKLKIFLDELDRRRKTNWRAIFPYLDISLHKEAK
jgi:hypothetical protein